MDTSHLLSIPLPFKSSTSSVSDEELSFSVSASDRESSTRFRKGFLLEYFPFYSQILSVVLSTLVKVSFRQTRK